jgi:solute carrier family 34 (sodium-dependent phosphate cotransporter)
MDAGGVQERALPAQGEHASEQQAHVPKAAWRIVAAVGYRSLLVLAALAVFIFALEILKAGAGGLSPILEYLDVTGTANVLGFGWFGSYLVLSGSPVAAIGLTLFSQDVISDTEAFALINGTRMGASFIVVFVGFLYYIRGRRNPDGLYIGVVALLVAITLWGPVVPIGYVILNEGWFDSVRFGSPGALTSFVDLAYDPLVTWIAARVPELLMFVVGVGVLLLAFSIFDRVLPNLEAPGPKFERAAAFFQQRYAMFGFGILVTGITMSVSLSLTILVPLTLKGYVKRDNIIPYVMGANIATWVDTLFAALLLDTPRAFTIVFVEMVTGATVSLIVLVLLYRPYKRMILSAAHLATRDRRGFAVFLGAILFVPGVLLLV